jgi:uncharacterized membrane protein
MGTQEIRHDTHVVEATVTIRREIDDVFGFYRDFRNFPRFLGDVTTIEPVGPATYRWTVQGPFGLRTRWTTRTTEERPNELIRYETVPFPGLATRWEVHFSRVPGSTDTRVREVMCGPFGRLGTWALALIGKFPDKEVCSNLHRLKELMETGRVSDTSYAVAGKFAPR